MKSNETSSLELIWFWNHDTKKILFTQFLLFSNKLVRRRIERVELGKSFESSILNNRKRKQEINFSCYAVDWIEEQFLFLLLISTERTSEEKKTIISMVIKKKISVMSSYESHYQDKRWRRTTKKTSLVNDYDMM